MRHLGAVVEWLNKLIGRKPVEKSESEVEVVKTILSPDGQRRLQIVAYAGIFLAAEDVRAVDAVGELCWTPISPSDVAGLRAATAEIAESEATSRLSWLVNHKPVGKPE